MSSRPESSDFLQGFRFHADAIGIGERLYFQRIPGYPQAGFSAITTPEVTVEPAEYSEGTDIYTRKYPGKPSMSDCTFSRGVTRQSSAFWDWLRVVIEGSGEYRAKVLITQFHRENTLSRGFPGAGGENQTKLNLDAGTGRQFILHQSFPTRHKFSGDLDATSSEVSIQELDIAYENVESIEYAP